MTLYTKRVPVYDVRGPVNEQNVSDFIEWLDDWAIPFTFRSGTESFKVRHPDGYEPVSIDPTLPHVVGTHIGRDTLTGAFWVFRNTRDLVEVDE